MSQGKVYLVLASDTAIWDAMDVSKYHCTYNLDLFTAVNSNTSVVMSESFRNQITDSYGGKLKMTWYMMAGNIFRYATNNNVPINNTMTLYLMKKYFGDKVELWNDELSLHYHTFFWSDYDGDGKYWWNQSETFMESKDDFDFTLAQFLLDENVFPVSFRSGWYYMDNDWQNYLNEILPYSLHNEYPNINHDFTEPIDNNFDWSQSSPEFVPFHPSSENYQLPGNDKGWNVRAKYMGSTTQQLMNEIFSKADQGTDQLVCLWSHLPDANFMNEIQNVNNLAHQAELNYPNVQFKYCTAVEAYQLWLQSNDLVKPVLQLSEEINGSDYKYLISTDEEIFQAQPFVAIKDRYERYFKAECELIEQNLWRTVSSYSMSEIGKVGAAVTDTVGNLSTSFIKYLPDDLFIDNSDPQYQELYGNWNTSTTSAWDVNSRIVNLNNGDSAKVRWNLDVGQSGLYNLFIQFPEIVNPVDTIKVELFQNDQIKDTIFFTSTDKFYKWGFVATLNLDNSQNNFLEMSARNFSQDSRSLAMDVIKLTAYIRDKQLVADQEFVDAGETSIDDTLQFTIELSNIGIDELTVSDIFSTNGNIEPITTLPMIITGMDKIDLQLVFIPQQLGIVEDTIVIISDDPINSIKKIPFIVNVENYFVIIDNDDIENYSETGTWATSVAQAYGPSSRYAYIQYTPNGPTAAFTFQLNRSGYYDIFEIIPQTINSANNALYKILVGDRVIDSLYLNQNEGSGNWKNIGRFYLPADSSVSIKVIDSGESSSGPVIRADAFKVLLYEESPINVDEDNSIQVNEYQLDQNYPNPFNPSTRISWQSPVGSHQTLKVFDVLGNEISTLVDEYEPAGRYELEFNAAILPSGVYFYRLQSGSYVETRKMIYLK
ncbi:MAG TPA: T9SS type A sorting domain-containing protein [Ignavibacteriaceae bacterium]